LTGAKVIYLVLLREGNLACIWLHEPLNMVGRERGGMARFGREMGKAKRDGRHSRAIRLK
jgi:hypothetical protein